MSRQSMELLVSRVRTMIGDTDDAAQVFTDDDIENSLDQHRHDIWFAPLQPLPTFVAGQPVEFLNYIAPGSIGAWEADYKIQRTDYTELASPSLGYTQVIYFEPFVGRFNLLADTSPSDPAGIRGIALRITGKVYDLFWASSDLLRMWAGKYTLQFTFSGDRQVFNRGEQIKNLLMLSDNYLSQAQPVSSRLWQGDAHPDHTGGGVVYPQQGSGSVINNS